VAYLNDVIKILFTDWPDNKKYNYICTCKKKKKSIFIMANHKSSEKRIRQTTARNEGNKYYAKTMRNALKTIRASTSKKEAEEMLPKMDSMLDRLAKKKIIHSKKAANLKSSVIKHVNSLK
jgi:small subunit ribosomal protein S20